MVNAKAFYILIPLLHFARSQVTCYLPDGNPFTNPAGGWNSSDYSPNVCNPGAAISSCCSTADFCLSNGLCLNGGGDNYFSIQGCTDKSWSSPCLNICAGQALLGPCYPNPATGGEIAYYCLPFSNGSNSCSNQSNIYTLPIGEIQIRSFQIPKASSLTSTSSTSSATTTTPTSANATLSSATNAKAVSVGLGVGLGLGFPLALGFVTALVLLFRKARENKELQEKEEIWLKHEREMVALQVQTEPMRDTRSEVDGRELPQELPPTSVR